MECDTLSTKCINIIYIREKCIIVIEMGMKFNPIYCTSFYEI